MEHLHDDGVVVVLELVVDVVRHHRRAHVSWRLLSLHGDVYHERDGGHHGDVDVDDLRLHRLGTPNMIDLLAVALRMMKGKNVWPRPESPPSLHLAPPFVRKASCRCSPFSLLQSDECRWRGSRCALAILIVRLAFVVVDQRWTLW